MTEKQYSQLISELSPKSPMGKDCLLAFLVGGLICTLGQALSELYGQWLSEEDAGTLVSVTLVFLGALLTGLGVYDDIARFAGAGTLVPITGFANAVVSPALEFKHEGLITGTACKMFSVAGPVIVYGTVASVLYGVVYWALQSAGG